MSLTAVGSPGVRHGFSALLLGGVTVVACGGTEPTLPDDPGSGGAPASGGMAPMSSAGSNVTPTGGTGGTGGAGGAGGAPASGGAGTTGAGGAGGSAGVLATGGSGGVMVGRGGMAGAGGMVIAMGGMPAAGQSGTAGMPAGGMSAGGMSAGGSAGSGGGKPPADPSAGCGKTNPATGSSGSPLNVSSHQYYVKLPTGYDANKPYPVIMMFHPTGNPLNWAEQNAGFESNGAKDGAIRVYPGAANNSAGWGSGDVSFFRPFYDKIIADYCVDKARVFAAGESSGGDFSSILGCEYADLVRGIAPCATKNVNGYPLDANQRECTGQVHAIIIHGKNDNVVGPENGPKTRDFYVALNHCETTPAPVPVMNYSDTLSNCLEYQGCDEGYPVFWCQHTDPEYSNTNHGWPKFAGKFVWEQFSKL